MRDENDLACSFGFVCASTSSEILIFISVIQAFWQCCF